MPAGSARDGVPLPVSPLSRSCRWPSESGRTPRLSVFAVLVLALVVSRLLGDLLVGNETTDLAAFIGAPVVLCATALLASYLPACRASRTDPVAALRAD